MVIIGNLRRMYCSYASFLLPYLSVVSTTITATGSRMSGDTQILLGSPSRARDREMGTSTYNRVLRLE